MASSRLTAPPTPTNFSDAVAKASPSESLGLGGVLKYTGPFRFTPVLNLLYGLLSLGASITLPRLSKQTIPDIWNSIYRAPFKVRFGFNCDGITSGVEVGGALTLLGCTASFNGRVFSWRELLGLNVSVDLTTFSLGVGVGITKPNAVIDGLKQLAASAAYSEGYRYGQDVVADMARELDATRAALTAAQKKARSRR